MEAIKKQGRWRWRHLKCLYCGRTFNETTYKKMNVKEETGKQWNILSPILYVYCITLLFNKTYLFIEQYIIEWVARWWCHTWPMTSQWSLSQFEQWVNVDMYQSSLVIDMACFCWCKKVWNQVISIFLLDLVGRIKVHSDWQMHKKCTWNVHEVRLLQMPLNVTCLFCVIWGLG